MFCKNCGREQKIGQKFCPICGTQFAVVVNKEQEDEADTCQCLPKTASVDDEAKKLMSEENTIEEKKVDDRKGESVTPETAIQDALISYDSPVDEKQNGADKNANVGKTIEEKEALIKNIVLGIFSVCIFFGCILIFFGGADSTCESFDFSSSSSSSFVEEKDDYGPDWLTSFRFDSEPSNGVVTSLMFRKDGTCVSSAHDRYTGRRMSFDGTFSVKGNTIYINLQGASSTIYFTIDNSRQRIVSSSGAVFKQSL